VVVPADAAAGPDQPGQPQLSASSCTVGADGTCAITITSTEPGTYHLHALVNGVDISGYGDPAKSSPQRLVWMGPDAFEQARVELIANGVLADGHAEDIIRVVVTDWNGLPMLGAGVTAAAPAPVQTAPILPTGPDGATQIAFTSTVPGAYPVSITVTLGGVTLSDSQIDGAPVTLVFTAPPPVTLPGTLEWSVTPEGPLAPGHDAANGYIATATLRDAHGNPAANVAVSFGVTPAPGTNPAAVPPSATCVTDVTGQCSVRLGSLVAGSFIVTPSAGPDFTATPASGRLTWQDPNPPNPGATLLQQLSAFVQQLLNWLRQLLALFGWLPR